MEKKIIEQLLFTCFFIKFFFSGGMDKKVKLFDCNDRKSNLTWEIDGECEKLQWHPLQPFIFFAGTSIGSLQCFDCRKGRFSCYLQIMCLIVIVCFQVYCGLCQRMKKK